MTQTKMLKLAMFAGIAFALLLAGSQAYADSLCTDWIIFFQR